jgi:hypothetical protein
MRRVVFAALVCLAAGAPAAAAEFPFTGYIATREAEVASGPGRRFYTTGKLTRGAEVEVYREDDAGWLAIRPPEGSFSWVPAEHIEPLDDDMGKVRSVTEAWIGTRIEDVKEHKSQVALKVGEVVEIVDRKSVKTDSGEEAWLKIAPPAGEFRFVHSRDVSREPVEPEAAISDGPQSEESIDAQAEPEPDEPRLFRPAGGAIAVRDIQEVRGKLAAMRRDLAGLTQDTNRDSLVAAAGNSHRGVPSDGAAENVQLAQYQAITTASRSLSPDGFVPRKRRGSEQLGPVPVPSLHSADATVPSFSRPMRDAGPQVAHARPFGAAATSPVSTLGPAATTHTTASAPAGDLAQLELELSLMVAQDKSAWNLAAIRSRVEELVERGATPAQRGEARILLDKIKQFEDAFAVDGHGPLGAATAAESAAAGDSPYAPRYDATGWLKPVVSRSKPAAPYAIVDQAGKPLAFVTPSPGLNIARYANKEVGLFGKRGYIQELKTPHVLAERVIDLERHVR